MTLTANESMTKTEGTTYIKTDITTLPTAKRHSAAMRKYAEAVRIYKETGMQLRDIASRCGVTAAGLSAYIGRHHRDLLLKKYGIATLDCGVCIKRRDRQSIHAYKKYRTAIAACSDMAFIEYNVSQIAVMFGHSGAALASQLRFHYPEVIPERERVRHELGIADNIRRGARQSCVESYAEAVAMYRDTDMTVKDVAAACDVSASGLSQHLQFYNKSVVEQKAARRDSCIHNTDADRSGTLSGNGRKYGPKPDSVAKYAKALELYRSSSMTLKEIVGATGVPYSGFRSYLQLWHSGEKRHRPRVASSADRETMTRLADGRLVRRASAEKYARAIEEYATSAKSLKDIAEKHGLVYNSLSGYVRRNCPEERESHRRILDGL